uniref:SAP domain-containing protein n=1 Tax=Phytophthora ramorum TaxID=164328 RepID=H3GQ66_PHYRM
MKLEADALDHLKVKDLQRELKKRGLDTGGLKATLHQRLKEHLQQVTEVFLMQIAVEEAAPIEETEETKEKSKEEEVVQDKGEDDTGGEEEMASDAEEQSVESVTEEGADANEEDKGKDLEETVVRKKRGADAVEEENVSDVKRPKLAEEAETSPQPEDEDIGEPPSSADAESSEQVAYGGAATTDDEKRNTLRIDNFIRPFTLNAVKALVQECGDFVEDGFWMDAIKTHCFVTYSTPEIAEKTIAALNGKVWPPENGRSLKITFTEHTAKEKVTIDEFFQKTETKPVLYYLPLTDEQIKEKKQRQSQQQQEGQPRKRRHRGGRKRNRRGRFRR